MRGLYFRMQGTGNGRWITNVWVLKRFRRGTLHRNCYQFNSYQCTPSKHYKPISPRTPAATARAFGTTAQSFAEVNGFRTIAGYIANIQGHIASIRPTVA